MGATCSTIGNMRNAAKIIVRKPEDKRLLGRPRRGWENTVI